MSWTAMKFGLEVVELLLQRLGRGAGDEQLALVAADLPADLVLLAGEVVVLVGRGAGSRARCARGSRPRRPAIRRAPERAARRRRRLPSPSARAGALLGHAPLAELLGAGARQDPGGLPLVDRFLRRGLGAGRRPLVALRQRSAASPFDVSQANLPLPPELLIDGSRSGAPPRRAVGATATPLEGAAPPKRSVIAGLGATTPVGGRTVARTPRIPAFEHGRHAQRPGAAPRRDPPDPAAAGTGRAKRLYSWAFPLPLRARRSRSGFLARASSGGIHKEIRCVTTRSCS